MSIEIDMPLEHALTITDVKAYADGRIYGTYRWLRANAPVSRCTAPGFDPFWVLARHADVQAVSRNNRLFPYGDRPSVLRNQATEKLMRAMAGGAPTPLKTLIQMDAPEHMKHRLLTQAWFMPKHLKTVAERIAVIANAQIDGQPISDAHALALAYYIIIATAGHDTTSSSTAAGMWALATQPALLKRLRRDPAAIPRFVEEAIRWATPVKTFMRSAAADTRLGDQAIGAGDWLMLCYASANRDEAVFPHGDDFDIDRPATGIWPSVMASTTAWASTSRGRRSWRCSRD